MGRLQAIFIIVLFSSVCVYSVQVSDVVEIGQPKELAKGSLIGSYRLETKIYEIVSKRRLLDAPQTASVPFAFGSSASSSSQHSPVHPLDECLEIPDSDLDSNSNSASDADSESEFDLNYLIGSFYPSLESSRTKTCTSDENLPYADLSEQGYREYDEYEEFIEYEESAEYEDPAELHSNPVSAADWLPPQQAKVQDEYELDKQLGQGRYGEVWRATRAGDEESTYVLKRLFVEKGDGVRRSGLREIHFGIKLRGLEHIGRFVEFFEMGAGELWIVYHYEGIALSSWMYSTVDQGGMLSRVLSDRWHAMKQDTLKGSSDQGGWGKGTVLRMMLQQIVTGVALVHHFGTTHRDLKPENILIADCPQMEGSAQNNNMGRKDQAREPNTVQQRQQMDLADVWNLLEESPSLENSDLAIVAWSGPSLDESSSNDDPNNLLPMYQSFTFLPSHDSFTQYQTELYVESSTNLIDQPIRKDDKSLQRLGPPQRPHEHEEGERPRLHLEPLLLDSASNSSDDDDDDGQSERQNNTEDGDSDDNESVDPDSDFVGYLRICDFGNGVDDSETVRRSYGNAGPRKDESTMPYAPPEVIYGNIPFAPNGLSRSYDIWSVGVVMLELLIGTSDVFRIDDRTRATVYARLSADTPSKTHLSPEVKRKAELFQAFLDYCIYRLPLAQDQDPASTITPTQSCNDTHFIQILKRWDPLKIGAPNIWAIKLLRRLLDWDPETRISAKTALTHAYFAGPYTCTCGEAFELPDELDFHQSTTGH